MSEDHLASRIKADAFVVVVHVASVAGVYTQYTEFADTKAGQLLLGMEVITIIFHACYVALLLAGRLLDPEGLNRFKWLEYAASATVGGFALAYANGDPKLPTSTQILLAGAGIAQQCSGFQLESEQKTIGTTIVAYISALGLQIGEFAVVYLALSDGIELHGASEYATWRAFGTYVVGYSLFGIIMLLWLGSTNKDASFEILYSFGGLIAKLGLLFSELAVFNSSHPGADAVLAFECIFAATIIFFSARLVWPQSALTNTQWLSRSTWSDGRG